MSSNMPSSPSQKDIPMRHLTRWVALVVLAMACVSASPLAQTTGTKRWVQGKGWGWVWGPTDEVGSLNEMTDA